MVPGRILGCSCCNGEDTRGYENEAHLVAAGLSGWAAAGMAVAPWPSGLPQHRGLPGVASMAVHALRQLTCGGYLRLWFVASPSPVAVLCTPAPLYTVYSPCI